MDIKIDSFIKTIELVVKGYHVSLRVEEAANIMVDNVSNRNQ